MDQMTEEQRKRVIAMLDEWEHVRAGVTALKIIGEVVKWVLGIAVAVAAVLGFSSTGK